MKEQLSSLMSRLLCTEQRSQNHLLLDTLWMITRVYNVLPTLETVGFLIACHF